MPAVSQAQQQAAAMDVIGNLCRQSMAMTPTEAAYIAGFLDGEGYVTIMRAGPKRQTFRCWVGFTNRDIAVLQWIQSFLGGSLYAKAWKSAKHAIAWELNSSSHLRNRHFLKQLRPHVQVKRRQIDVALAFLSLGKMKKFSIPRGRADPSAVLERQGLLESIQSSQ